MTKSIGESFHLVRRLGGTDEYYRNGSMFWFSKDPSIIFIIKKNGKVLIKELLTEKSLSVYELWTAFTKEQRSLVAYNLDKFECINP
jgi:hypothetical protein